MAMSEGVEGPGAAGSGRPRWLVLDIVLVLVLTFGLHRLLTRTLSGPVLWWSYSPALLMLVLGYLLVRRRRLPAGVSPCLLTWRKAMFAVGAAGGLLVVMWLPIAGFAYLAQLAGEAPATDTPWWLPMRTGGSVALPVAILAVTVGPFVEEYVFRGIVYAELRERIRAVPAAVLSAAAFAAFHPRAVAFSFAIGLMLAAVYRRTGSLMAAVLAHAAVNGIMLVVTALAQRAGLGVSPV